MTDITVGILDCLLPDGLVGGKAVPEKCVKAPNLADEAERQRKAGEEDAAKIERDREAISIVQEEVSDMLTRHEPADSRCPICGVIVDREDRSKYAEALIRACVPGGSICDPQQVADAIREFMAPEEAGGPLEILDSVQDRPVADGSAV